MLVKVPEIFAFTVRRAIVDRHTVRRQCRADDVFVTRCQDAGVLVQAVRGIGNGAKVRAAGVATEAGGLPVTDVVVGVAKLLARDGRDGVKIRPFALGAGQLIAIVIAILPEGAVFERGLRTAIDRIVLIGV